MGPGNRHSKEQISLCEDDGPGPLEIRLSVVNLLLISHLEDDYHDYHLARMLRQVARDLADHAIEFAFRFREFYLDHGGVPNNDVVDPPRLPLLSNGTIDPESSS